MALGPPPGHELNYASVINDKGQIAGVGTFNSQDSVFLLTPSYRQASRCSNQIEQPASRHPSPGTVSVQRPQGHCDSPEHSPPNVRMKEATSCMLEL